MTAPAFAEDGTSESPEPSAELPTESQRPSKTSTVGTRRNDDRVDDEGIEVLLITGTRVEKSLFEIPASITSQDTLELRRNGFTFGTDASVSCGHYRNAVINTASKRWWAGRLGGMAFDQRPWVGAGQAVHSDPDALRKRAGTLGTCTTR